MAFTSKDQNLNKAHVQYLEARLVAIANEAKRCELDNSNVPQLPSLAEADGADAELYLDDMLLCLPVIGVEFFEKPAAQAATAVSLRLSGKGVEARGYEEAGGFVVRIDSRAVKDEVPSIAAAITDLRKVLVTKGVLVEEKNTYRLTQDYVFNSPSQAADVLQGNSSNGREAWTDAQGRTLKKIQQSGAEPT